MSQNEKKTLELDDVDRKILALIEDPESGAVEPALSQIATTIGITPGTVKNRLRTLRENRILRGYAGLVDKPLYEKDLIFAVILLELQRSWDVIDGRQRLVGDVTTLEQIRKLPNVLAMFFCLGRFDVVLLCSFRNQLKLAEFLMRDLREIRGVASTETLFTLPHTVMPIKVKGAAIIPFEKEGK